MAFSAAGLNCIGVGPTKLYIYYTTDTLATNAAGYMSTFNTTDCPGMAAGDIVILAHNTNAKLGMVRIASINATSALVSEVKALA